MFALGNELTTRISIITGIAPFGVIALVVLGCVAFYGYAQKR